MSVIINGTAGVTFPDSVLQTSGVPGPGSSANVLTSNGTIWVSQAPVATTTIPAANLTGSTLLSNVTSSSLTALGNVTTGTWSADTIAVNKGGTGLTSTPSNGQLDIGNGTGFTRATLTAGSGISITNGSGSISIAATGGGTVTSVATGNGLSGGTITTSGTLTVACPSFNSVGSYCFAGGNTEGVYTAGSNYSAGEGVSQIRSAADVGSSPQYMTNLSGTWKWMSATANSNTGAVAGLACRVS